MEKLLKAAKAIPLSGRDIYDILDGDVNILTYKDLAEVKDLDQILNKPCVILYETNENFGHWTLLLKIHKDTIELFDSYAYMPDEQIKFIPSYFRDEKNSLPHLSWLLATSKKYNKIISNTVKLQKSASDINTCGRWVIMRCITWRDFNMSLKDFIETYRHSYGKLHPDDIVTLNTMFLE